MQRHFALDEGQTHEVAGLESRRDWQLPLERAKGDEQVYVCENGCVRLQGRDQRQCLGSPIVLKVVLSSFLKLNGEAATSLHG